MEIIEVNQLMTQEELDKCEVIIEKGKQTFIEVGNALREIRDRKGYRLQYGTFEEYCKQRWDFSVRTGKNLIDASGVAKNLQAIAENVDYTKAERISSLPPDQQLDFAQQNNIADMTSREVEKAVKDYKLKLADAEGRIAKLADAVKVAEEENGILRSANKDLENRPKEVIYQEPDDYQELQDKVANMTIAQMETAKMRKLRQSVGSLMIEIGAQLAVIFEKVRESTDEDVDAELKKLTDYFEYCGEQVKNFKIKGSVMEIDINYEWSELQ